VGLWIDFVKSDLIFDFKSYGNNEAPLGSPVLVKGLKLGVLP